MTSAALLLARVLIASDFSAVCVFFARVMADENLKPLRYAFFYAARFSAWLPGLFYTACFFRSTLTVLLNLITGTLTFYHFRYSLADPDKI